MRAVLSVLLTVLFRLYSVSGSVGIDCPVEPNTKPSYFTYNECTDGSSACTYYSVRIGPNADNDSFVDFYLETSAKGYAAVGFSKNRNMPSTDVLGCGRDSNGALRVRDTWNPSYYNEDDPNQDGMCVHSITYENSMIMCKFSRYAPVINVGYDFDLNDTYYLLFAYSDNQGSDSNFPPHSTTGSSLPKITINIVSVYEDNSNSNASSSSSTDLALIRAHGILMTVAWPLLAAIGIFFSAWTKPAFPKGQWFQFHRALMISSVAVSVIGLVLIFVANRGNTVPGIVNFSCSNITAHFAIGILVTTFQILNPLIALCRPKPESNRRFIFNLVHGSGIGFLAQAFALVNVGLGMAIFQSGCLTLSKDNHILWVYLTWIAFFVIYQGSLFCIFLISSIKNNGSNLAPTLLKPLLKHHLDKDKMSDFTEATDTMSLQDSKVDEDDQSSKDSGVRIAAMGIFCVVTFIFTIILVVLLAID